MRTERLTLEPLSGKHLVALAALHTSDPVVEWLGGALDREACLQMIDQAISHHREYGWGLYALTDATRDFVGLAGLQPAGKHLPIAGIEAVWRLRRESWGQGFAVEAMRTILSTHNILAPSIFAVTAAANIRSRRTMDRLGFVHDPTGDFENPRLPERHPLRQHVVYRYAPPKSSV